MTTRTADYIAQRDAIAAIVASISEVGRVHRRPRYGDAAEHWIVNYDGIPRIRAWEIGLGGPVVATDSTDAFETRRWPWIIRGYVGLEDHLGDNPELDADGSYDTMLYLAAAIADAINADKTLGGVTLDIEAPPTITEPVTLTVGGGALCWGISVTFTTWSVHQL